MRKNFLFVLISLFAGLLVLYSCETNPPNSVEKEYGELAISSNLDGEIDSIKIFIDNKFSGKYSPATLTLETGSHNVYLQYDSVKTNGKTVEIRADILSEVYFVFQTENGKKVLLEDFANVSCDPCVESSAIIHNLKESGYPDDELVVLRYATNFPSPNDPFYRENPDLFDSRISFYNVLFAPTVIVNGTSKPIPTDSVDIRNAIETALSSNADFSINITSSLTIDSLHISITLDYPSSNSTENLILFTVVGKRVIEFSEAPGSNGQTVFYDVVTKMLPGNEGIPLNSIADKTVVFNVENAEDFTDDNFFVAAFIQNKITKEILQSNTN